MRGLTSLITHEDIAVLVAINAVGIYVIDECECVNIIVQLFVGFFFIVLHYIAMFILDDAARFEV